MSARAFLNLVRERASANRGGRGRGRQIARRKEGSQVKMAVNWEIRWDGEEAPAYCKCFFFPKTLNHALFLNFELEDYAKLGFVVVNWFPFALMT